MDVRRHGERRERWKGFWKQEMGPFWGAEAVSSVFLPGLSYLEERFVPKRVINFCAKWIGKGIEPVLDPIEKSLTFVCRLEECQPDMTKSRQERAQNLGRIVTIFGPPAALTYAAKLGVRRALGFKGPENAKWWQPWKMTKQEWMLFGTDEGAHMLLIGAVQGPFAKQGDKAIRDLKSVFIKCGIAEHTAHEIAAALVLHEGPNLGGAITGSGGLALNRLIYASPPGHN